jgi:hypothetical protein
VFYRLVKRVSRKGEEKVYYIVFRRGSRVIEEKMPGGREKQTGALLPRLKHTGVYALMVNCSHQKKSGLPGKPDRPCHDH